MTTRADFSDEEWSTIASAPPSAGMLVMTAQRGGFFRETMAMARAYTEARGQHGSSELLDELVSSRPETDRSRYGSPEELRDAALAHLRDAVDVLQRKATPAELDDYRRFVRGVAERVASAHREHGVEVSPAEQALLAEIERTLGAA
jgi:hypothetical protein